MLDHWHATELGESRLEIVQSKSIWPVVLVRSAKNLEDLENLVNLRVSHEQRTSLHHLSKDAACRPEIDSEGISFLAEQNLWTPVPECDDLMSIGFDRESESSG